MHTRTRLVRSGAGLATIALVATTLLAPVATARELVDPSTLDPAPPDTFHAVCARSGIQTLCEYAFADPPAVALPSGLICDGVELLDDGQRTVVGRRFYDADGRLVRRHFHEDLHGTFTNPSTGRWVRYSAGDQILHDLTVPGDIGSGTDRISGAYFRITAADGGTILTDAGTLTERGGELATISAHHPFFDYGSDPSAIAPICAAVG